MTTIKTYMGKDFDWNQLIQEQGHVISAGNSHFNARGDLIGHSGKVLKTKEQLAEEYYTNNPDAVQHTTNVSLNTKNEIEMLKMANTIREREISKPLEPSNPILKTNINHITNPNQTITFEDVHPEQLEETDFDEVKPTKRGKKNG